MMRLFRMLSGLLSAAFGKGRLAAIDPHLQSARRAYAKVLDIRGECAGRRVIVVGDIHGCYDEFMLLLGKCRYTEEDVVVSVGDVAEAAPQPPCRPCKPVADPEWRSSKTTYKCSRPQGDFGAQAKTYRHAATLLDLRRLFRGRGINVRGDRQLLVATEEVCRELDAIRAQVGEQLLRDMGLADCGTPGSDEMPGWSGHDDD